MEDFFAIKGKLRVYKGHETNQNSFFGLILLGQPWRGKNRARKRRRRIGRRRRRRKGRKSGMESCVIWVFWMSRVFGMIFPWRLVAPCSRVLWRDHNNPRILEVLWEKP